MLLKEAHTQRPTGASLAPSTPHPLSHLDVRAESAKVMATARSESEHRHAAATLLDRDIPIYSYWRGDLTLKDFDLSSIEIVGTTYQRYPAKTLEGEIANSIKERMIRFLGQSCRLHAPAQIFFRDRRTPAREARVPADAIILKGDTPTVLLEIFVSPRGDIEESRNLTNGIGLLQAVSDDAYGCRLIIDCSEYSGHRVKPGCISLSEVGRAITHHPKNGDYYQLRVDAKTINELFKVHGMDAEHVFRAFAGAHQLGFR